MGVYVRFCVAVCSRVYMKVCVCVWGGGVVYMKVCVCVCVRVRERESICLSTQTTEGGRNPLDPFHHSLHTSPCFRPLCRAGVFPLYHAIFSAFPSLSFTQLCLTDVEIDAASLSRPAEQNSY